MCCREDDDLVVVALVVGVMVVVVKGTWEVDECGDMVLVDTDAEVVVGVDNIRR